MYADPEVAALFGAAEFTGRMLAFEAAWTRALHRAGAIGAADAAAALAVIAGFGRVDFGAGSEVDGLPVPALVTALRAGLEGSVAGAIHTGATSQDVIDSAMALTLLEVQDLLEARLSALVGAVSDLGERFGDRPLMARTRMQAALPATAGLRIGAWRRALEGQLARAGAARAEIARVQVGGPVGLRGDEAVAAAVARDLGLTLTPVWHADRSGPVSLGHWLTLVAGSLGKIGQDVALMAQQGVDEIALRGGGGSSAMPHKANPVAAEAMVTLARFVAAQQGALAQAMVHEQERSGAAWALEWMILPAMAEATGAALSHGLALMGQVERIGAA
jgi:3-carboxy-cis,cis-muconate cycloisomerase